jgi:hypothetical protein
MDMSGMSDMQFKEYLRKLRHLLVEINKSPATEKVTKINDLIHELTIDIES